MVTYIDHEPCPACGTEKAMYGECPNEDCSPVPGIRVQALDRPRPHQPSELWAIGFSVGLALGILIALAVLGMIGTLP